MIMKYVNDFMRVITLFSIVSRFMTKNQSPIRFGIGFQADPKPNPRPQLPTPTLTINNNSHGGLRKLFFYFQCMVIFNYSHSICMYQSVSVI